MVEKCGICSFIKYPGNRRYATFILISSTILLSDGNPYRCCINTILNITTRSMLGIPLSAQYNSSTISYMCVKSMALSIFLNKCSSGTNSSMLNISIWLRFSLCFTISFITAFIIPHICEKAQLLPDFFDKLTCQLLYRVFFVFLFNKCK